MYQGMKKRFVIGIKRAIDEYGTFVSLDLSSGFVKGP